MTLCADFTGFTLLNSACAQNPPGSQAYVKEEEKLVEKSTVLLNNDKYFIPLRDLGNA